MSSVKRLAYLLLIFASPLCWTSNHLDKANASVVKILSGNATASGFVWHDSAHVVTALHVVDNNSTVSVLFYDANGKNSATSKASVVKVLQAADLALLKLDKPQNRPPLVINTSIPLSKEVLDALGFPLNIAQSSTTEVKVRFGGDKLKSILPPKVLNKITKYPDVNTTIINLEGNLVPGLSGAPILDKLGSVVGIADGGLERGAIGISWGIPAKYLHDLLASAETSAPGLKKVEELFAADLDVDIGETHNYNGIKLVKLKSRTFSQLSNTADDKFGLNQLLALFAPFNPYSFEYDIYQDLNSDATLVIPKGATIYESEELNTVLVGNNRFQMKFKVESLTYPNAEINASIQFENSLTEFNPAIRFIQQDTAWSYMQPMFLGDVKIIRKGFFRSTFFQNRGWQRDRYYFETLAANSSTLLAVAAVDLHSNMQIANEEMACVNSNPYALRPPQYVCQQHFSDRRVWAQMVLGVQFATFPLQRM
jgi:hypothetical protein